MPEPANSNVKQTPGRRRPGPHAARSASRKTYASENDACAADPNFQPDFARRNQAPKTPQKRGTKSPAPNSLPASGKTTRRSGNNNNQPKNMPTSPAPTKPGRRTPPQTAGPKAAASTAFAGATFHASPAPSSLPLPSFFTKNNSPGTPQTKPGSSLSQAPSSPASDSEVVSTVADHALTSATTSSSGESPLDIFFRADRAEKEHARRNSSAGIFHTPGSHFSPPSQTASLQNHGSNTFPKGPPASQLSPRRPAMARNPAAGISVEELDGNPRRPIGPAFATPFQERMRAARPAEGRTPASADARGFRNLDAPSGSPSTRQMASVDDRSEALKRYLFSKTSNTNTTPGSASSNIASFGSALSSPSGPAPATPSRPNGNLAAAYQNIYATPSAPTTGHSDYPGTIAAMEDSLRQILKLDSPFSASAASPAYSRRS